MSYYDIDSILTEAEKIPCTFELDVPDLGYIDNNPGHGLKTGTKVSLPLWLAELLAVTSAARPDNPNPKGFVSLGMPDALSNEVLQALKADPRAVALRDRSPHFYGLAARVLDLFEEPELSAVLRRTFVTRAADIALHARKAGSGSGKNEGTRFGRGGPDQDFLQGLDELERKLFRKAHDGMKAEREWREGVKKH